ncbi:MFS transporter [Micromonospora sp. NPDC003197]
MVSDERNAHEGPATFREVFAQSEFRAVYASGALTWFGDYLTKAAVTLLVYQQTDSVAMSAAAFAVSFLPWLIGGPLLTTLAERYPYRRVMVVCDLARMALISLVAIPGLLPSKAILVVLFVSALANPPSQAARSALMPTILTGDRLVVGLGLISSTGQAAQFAGYLAGAGIAAINPHLALFVNTLTFALSAAFVRFGVRHRPPALSAAHRSHLLRETAEGFRIVFGTPVLRAIAILVFSSMLFAIVPEGLAAGWADEQSDGKGAPLAQAMIMAASPVGFILGGLVIGRGIRPELRQRLIRFFAVLSPLILVPALLNPPAPVVALLTAITGFSVAGLMPVANGLFVRALPHGYRARAFGVMGTGTQVMQGVAVLLTGLLANRYSIPLTVGLWSLAGTALMLITVLKWPTPDRFDAAIAEARRNDPIEETGEPHTADQPEETSGPPPRPPTSQAGVGSM